MALTYEQESLKISKKASRWENKFKSLMKLKSENPKAWAKKRGWYENQLTHAKNMLKEAAPNLQKLESKEALRIKELKEERAKLEQQVKAQESLVASRPNDPNIGQYRNMLKGSQSRLKAANIDLKNVDKRTQSKELLNQLSGSEKLDIELNTEIEAKGSQLFGPNSKVAKTGSKFPLVPKEWQNLGKIDSKTAGQLGIEYNANTVKDTPKFNTTNDLKIAKDPNEPTYKSDIFTIDPKTGEALGVMTRSQRRQWDADNQPHLQEWSKKNKDKLRVYKNTGGMMGAYERTGAG